MFHSSGNKVKYYFSYVQEPSWILRHSINKNHINDRKPLHASFYYLFSTESAPHNKSYQPVISEMLIQTTRWDKHGFWRGGPRALLHSMCFPLLYRSSTGGYNQDKLLSSTTIAFSYLLISCIFIISLQANGKVKDVHIS